MKQVKLPNEIVIAIGQYYINRSKQTETTMQASKDVKGKSCIIYNTVPSKTRWNKSADFDRIAAKAFKYGYHIQGCAGTFWLYKTNNRAYVVDENSWPLADIQTQKFPQKRTIPKFSV